MMWYELGLSLLAVVGYCAVNAGLLTGIWHTLRVGTSAARSFKDVFLKTGLSIVIVWALALFIGRMFCWTAMVTHCLACICPVTAGLHVGHISAAGMLLFLIATTFVQLTLIAIPVRLSRMLFVLTLIASNVIAGLLKLGLHALLS